MTCKTVTVDVDVDIDLDEFDDSELVDEMNQRGYTCMKELEELDREDLDYLIDKLGDASDWQFRRTMDKIRKMRFG